MQHLSKSIFFYVYWFFKRLTILKGIYIHQMSCTRDDFYAKISLKEYFWQDLIGVWKITLLSKDPVLTCFTQSYALHCYNVTTILQWFETLFNRFIWFLYFSECIQLSMSIIEHKKISTSLGWAVPSRSFQLMKH